MAHRRSLVLVRVGLAALLVLSSAGCATGPVTWQPGNLQPLIVGWQQFFRIQWDASRENGQPIVEGYITNVWGSLR